MELLWSVETRCTSVQHTHMAPQMLFWAALVLQSGLQAPSGTLLLYRRLHGGLSSPKTAGPCVLPFPTVLVGVPAHCAGMLQRGRVASCPSSSTPMKQIPAHL